MTRDDTVPEGRARADAATVHERIDSDRVQTPATVVVPGAVDDTDSHRTQR
jgi:hypothetical protein